MNFNNTSSNNGLIQMCEQNLFGDNGFTKISSDTARLQMFTNYINEGYSRYTNLVITLDGKWQYDDSTYTTYAIAQTNLVTDQQDYAMETAVINILGVEIKSSDGTWTVLEEVDEAEFARRKQSMTKEYLTSGEPVAFNKTANSIFILPAPNYDSTSGLKVKFQRPPNYFVYTDTTKQAGFVATHHPYLVNYACSKYAYSRQMPNASYFQSEVDKMEKFGIPGLYGKREKDVYKRMRPMAQDNR